MFAQRKDAPIHMRRAHKRFDYEVSCLIQRDDQTLAAETRNISGGGLSLQLEGISRIEVGKVVTLVIDKCAPIDAVVRWSQERVYGFQFLTSVPKHPELGPLIARLEAGSSDDTGPF